VFPPTPFLPVSGLSSLTSSGILRCRSALPWWPTRQLAPTRTTSLWRYLRSSLWTTSSDARWRWGDTLYIYIYISISDHHCEQRHGEETPYTYISIYLSQIITVNNVIRCALVVRRHHIQIYLYLSISIYLYTYLSINLYAYIGVRIRVNPVRRHHIQIYLYVPTYIYLYTYLSINLYSYIGVD